MTGARGHVAPSQHPPRLPPQPPLRSAPHSGSWTPERVEPRKRLEGSVPLPLYTPVPPSLLSVCTYPRLEYTPIVTRAASLRRPVGRTPVIFDTCAYPPSPGRQQVQ
jgi:hypothetical protein